MSDPVIPDPNTTTKPTGKKAREISKWAMVTAALWIGTLSLVKGFWPLFAKDATFGLSMQDIILSGLAVAGVFSPVFVSIFLEKITGNKVGGE